MAALFLEAAICHCGPTKTMNFLVFEGPQRQMTAPKNRTVICHCGPSVFWILQNLWVFFVRIVLIKISRVLSSENKCSCKYWKDKYFFLVLNLIIKLTRWFFLYVARSQVFTSYSLLLFLCRFSSYWLLLSLSLACRSSAIWNSRAIKRLDIRRHKGDIGAGKPLASTCGVVWLSIWFF